MEGRLYAAALRNDTDALSQLLQEDPTLLDRANLNCEDKNALHAAATLGNEAFVRAILQANSSSTYHMCLARDRDGRNPVHLAAMYGKLNILRLLIDHDKRLIEAAENRLSEADLEQADRGETIDQLLMDAALQKADRGGTILHLCVKHNQHEALKLLHEKFRDPEFVGTKNDDGMTILHLAIYYNQNQSGRREMVTYLIQNTSKEMVNMKNTNGKTALDLVLEQGKILPRAFLEIKEKRKKLNHLLRQRNAVDLQILRSLAEAGALTGYEAISSQEAHAKRIKWLETRYDTIMVVAALIATMAFQAMVSPPGGVWKEDSSKGPNPHRAGEAVLAKTHPKYFRHLIRANTVAFVSSLSSIIVLIRGIAINTTRAGWFYLFTAIMWLSIAAIGISYAISFATLAPESERGQLTRASAIVVVVIMVWGYNSVLSAPAIYWGILSWLRCGPRSRRTLPSFQVDPDI